jgi:hypothetical protein
VLYADVDQAEIEQLLPQLDEWALDRPRAFSPRLERPFEWFRNSPSRSVAATDPGILTAPSAVTLTVWRRFEKDQLRFVRSIDMSALVHLPGRETLSRSFALESVIFPAWILFIPESFCEGCARLSHVGSADWVALDRVRWRAYEGCRSLREFVCPRMVSVIDAAFGGTAMVDLDLSGTRAKTVSVWYMKFLERLVLPRGCFLHAVSGLPSLRSVTFGTCDRSCSWNPVRCGSRA